MDYLWKSHKATDKSRHQSWRLKLHEIIFEADTRAGKVFDIILILAILLSVSAVMLESIPAVKQQYGYQLFIAEWTFTILFSAEYFLRITTVGRPVKYVTSFFGVVDFLAIVPTYLSLLLPGTQALAVIRILRVLRIFRVLKLVQYLGEAQSLVAALKASRRKIIVFMFTVVSLVVIIGSIMYLVESEESGFESIPHSIYWAIVTLTTVGYGDITPQTDLGKMLSAIVMILGYSILAVPTGIITAEITMGAVKGRISTQSCPECSAEGHDADAEYCKFCGQPLNPKS
ncbi:MAG: ion transporter [Calditrichaeota bacterium]|nr:MAG: ion transporter [Calditrichota bacterium]MBL1207418.1 ion transporter [Calditrichota bacterium]NOG47250.1 ion transporter [Calditrichota bacterium]